MIGTIPNHNDYSGPYPFYRYTNDLGTLTLNDSVLITTTAINSLTYLKSDLMWPNPVLNTLNIKTENIDKQYNQIKIINLSGTTILVGKFDNTTNKIDVSYFPSGIYILEISSSKGLVKQLFIKE